MERVWIYQSNRSLNTEETEQITRRLTAFLSQWKAHGKPLAAVVDVKYNRFVVIRLDEAFTKATGCSIDSLVRELKAVQEALGVDFFDRMQVAYRDKGELKVVSRKEFSDLMKLGEVDQDTIVFNNMVDNYADYSNRWEIPLKDSWHSRVFKA